MFSVAPFWTHKEAEKQVSAKSIKNLTSFGEALNFSYRLSIMGEPYFQLTNDAIRQTTDSRQVHSTESHKYGDEREQNRQTATDSDRQQQIQSDNSIFRQQQQIQTDSGFKQAAADSDKQARHNKPDNTRCRTRQNQTDAEPNVNIFGELTENFGNGHWIYTPVRPCTSRDFSNLISSMKVYDEEK
ncbi:hypothetical protein Tco_0389006 [Tanacetum coccineum]